MAPSEMLDESNPFRDRADKLPSMPIKPGYVKKTGNVLLEEYSDAFNADFEHNKKGVDTLTNIDSKDVRNRVAGYISRKKSGEAAEA